MSDTSSIPVSEALADRYVICERIGQGGMSTVYLARDTRHERQVAVKVLKPEVAESLGTALFLREIKLAARLQHPHILPVFDSGEHDGILYFVMPFVEGECLRSRLSREKRLLVQKAVEITIDIAEALDYAHRHDVVHRDIKPGNILLTTGHAIVADFGIATAVSGSSVEHGSPPELKLGTPAYMSPESVAPGVDVDGRSDIYSLGCVLFEMLTGEVPFPDPDLEQVLSQHASAPVPSLRAARPEAPDWLERALERALAKLPSDRYESAAQFAGALRPDASATRRIDTEIRAEAEVSPEGSIAVLPFVNMSADPNNDYFSDGVSEELMIALAKLPGLHVAARTSAFSFKGKNEDVRAISRKLNVRNILEGSVQKSGRRLRVSARLVNARDGYELWSEHFDRRLDDIFQVQDEITNAIAKVLAITLRRDTTTAIENRRVRDTQTYDVFLKARHFCNKRTTKGLRDAIRLFKEAIRLDPSSVAAFAGLAECYAVLGIYGAVPPKDVMPLAKIAADKALAIDPSASEVRATLGCLRAIFEWNWSGAEEEFQQAVTINPLYATAHHWYAMNCLTPQGRFDEALAVLRRAQKLDPLAPVVNTSIGILQYFAREYEAAASALLYSLAIEEHFGLTHFFLGLTNAEQWKLDSAIESLQNAIDLSRGSSEMKAALGYVYAKKGLTSEARAILAQLEQRAARHFVSPSLMSQIHVELGETEDALRCLEEALRVRSADLAWLGVRPVFDGLRENPRYQRLIEKMGL